MAIAYTLDLATADPVDRVAGALYAAAREVGLLDQGTEPAALLDGTLVGSGTWVRVGTATPAPWDPVAADLGFTPTVWVTFRLDKFSPLDHQEDDMVRLTSGLLARVAGDAVLHFQNEVVWLLRRAGQLTLNTRDDLWPPSRQAAIAQHPFTRETHAFAEE